MNVKTTIHLPEDLMRYAEEMVEDGTFPSIDSVLAASLEDMMISRSQTAVNEVVDSMADELRRRMELPRDQWIPWDGPSLIARVRKHRAEERGRQQ